MTRLELMRAGMPCPRCHTTRWKRYSATGNVVCLECNRLRGRATRTRAPAKLTNADRQARGLPCPKCGGTVWTLKWGGVGRRQKVVCRNCNRRYALRWQTVNRDRAQANFRALSPERKRNKKLANRYGITLDQFETLHFAQRGRCAICRTEPRLLHVDHCHATGRVRGLVCLNCNTILGHAKDNPDTLRAAARYLER